MRVFLAKLQPSFRFGRPKLESNLYFTGRRVSGDYPLGDNNCIVNRIVVTSNLNRGNSDARGFARASRELRGECCIDLQNPNAVLRQKCCSFVRESTEPKGGNPNVN